MLPSDPIVAPASAVGGAVAVIRSSGDAAAALFAPLFSRPLASFPPNTLLHGWLKNAARGAMADEVMAVRFDAPRSFTGEDMVEVYCHGGSAAVNAVLQAFFAAGFRLALPGEFTLRAFLRGKTDLPRAEAAAEITAAVTDAAREAALERLGGALADKIAGIKKALLAVRAGIEAEIEYPEDEEAFSAVSARAFSPLLEKIAYDLSSLSGTWAASRLLQQGARVVLAGKTNAGKSSLFNALLKADRAIVSPWAGTTRDVLESLASFDGIPVRLYDTAGLRDTEDAVEALGVERAREVLKSADCILYVIDSTAGFDAEDRAFLAEWKEAIPVWNKTDLTPSPGDAAFPGVSARTGEGVGNLASLVAQSLRGNRAADGVGLGSERQKNCVDAAHSSVMSALAAEKNGFPPDAVSQDLEDALAALGEITGEGAASDVLEEIFSKFCLGK